MMLQMTVFMFRCVYILMLQVTFFCLGVSVMMLQVTLFMLRCVCVLMLQVTVFMLTCLCTDVTGDSVHVDMSVY